MISPAELAAMQATAAAALDETIVVQRATLADDGYGHRAETWATVATVTGNLAQPTGQLLQNYDYLIGSTSTWLVRVAAGTDIRAGDRLAVGGQTLGVQVLLQPHSYQTAMRVLASEVRP